MEEQHKEFEIRLQDLWWIFKRCWWQMLIVFVLVAAVVFSALTLTHEDEFTATASIYVLRNTNETLPNGSQTNFSSIDISLANLIIKDCDVLLRSRDKVLYPVLVAQNMDDVITVERMNRMISINNQEDTRVIYLSVTSSSPEKSADIANALVDQACDYVNNELYNQKILNRVDQATTPKNPSNPISLMTVALLAFVAAFAVYAIYFVLFLLDDKINNAEDVEKYLGLSMLGVIPNRNDVNRKKQKYGYYYGMNPNDDKSNA
ncbi:MAG: hypothetical protein IJF33_00495 [Clostridia bacterium]|nr:hypothetical protein [Clostridia bacterium]